MCTGIPLLLIGIKLKTPNRSSSGHEFINKLKIFFSFVLPSHNWMHKFTIYLMLNYHNDDI